MQLRGLGDPRPRRGRARSTCRCHRLLNLYVGRRAQLHRRRPSAFLGERRRDRTPFVIGVAGSVAVGKSTIARLLRELLARWPETPRGSSWSPPTASCCPNAELERRGLMQRKGFPETYDRRALLRFVADVKSGARRGARAGLLAPDLRHRARRADRSCASPTS